jgi:demethylmenaquinone methyltransferase / 2-methoxy-6-polyprenyl-1,4-benzoquinol methylase
MSPPPLSVREQVREKRFREVWTRELDAVFADVAPYYDRANSVASLGLWRWFRDVFMSTIEVRPGQKVLDVCAGTNAVGIALLEREPTLDVHAMDRSAPMQEVGRRRAGVKGFRIASTIGDVHELPFPDNSFDIVTLQYASRHLRVDRVFSEIYRVLKPRGRFHHCDMLRPGNPALEKLYFVYLRMTLLFTGFWFQSDQAALNLKRYFIKTLSMFYSPAELTDVLRGTGFRDVHTRTIFGGMIGCHDAGKPGAA